MHAVGPNKACRSHTVASPTDDVMAQDRSVHTQQVSCTRYYTHYNSDVLDTQALGVERNAMIWIWIGTVLKYAPLNPKQKFLFC